MKGCELCNQPARMYCESDGASLCWDCDAKVHSANFLVAKHSRSLLCHACQSPTPWIASGTDLGRTFSVCISCATRGKRVPVSQSQPEIQSRIDDEDRSDGNAGDEEATDSEEEEEEYSDDSDYGSDEDEDGDNQVVPWSCSTSPPCTAATSSSSEEDLSSSQLSPGGVSSLKRRRHDSDISSEDETECTSSTFRSEIRSPPSASQSYEGSTWCRSLRPPEINPIGEKILGSNSDGEFTAKHRRLS